MNEPTGRGKAKPKDKLLSSLPAACTDDAKAVELMEDLRWGGKPYCPFCGDESVRKMLGRDGQRNRRFLWRCLNRPACGKQFTVRIGTVMEESLIPLRHWCHAFWRATTSKKGVAAMEIHRQCQISYKSALYMMHRIRKAFETDWRGPPKLSGQIECDEVYIGGKPRGYYRRLDKNAPKRSMRYHGKKPVVAMLQRGGDIRAFRVSRVTINTIGELLNQNIRTDDARLFTDGSWVYNKPGREFAGGHEWVDHGAGEYARGEVTTNRVEGFFSILRRGLHGIYHSVSTKHLDRYINEFEWRYNHRALSDSSRVRAAIRDAEGKRLFYREPKAG